MVLPSTTVNGSTPLYSTPSTVALLDGAAFKGATTVNGSAPLYSTPSTVALLGGATFTGASTVNGSAPLYSTPFKMFLVLLFKNPDQTSRQTISFKKKSTYTKHFIHLNICLCEYKQITKLERLQIWNPDSLLNFKSLTNLRIFQVFVVMFIGK